MAGKVDIIVDAHTRKAESAINGFATATTNRIKAMDLAIRSLPIVALGTAIFKAVQGAGKFVSVGVEFNATIEQQTMAFKALLGTMDAAEKRVQSIIRFAATTPFELPGAIQANKVLQSLTNGALAGEEGMRLVGDAAAAAGKDFAETAMWVGRLYSGLESGTSVGEATMRLLEMGLITGETKRQLDGMAASGAQGAKAMDLIRTTFGRTAGAMEDQSRTFNGLMSTAKDTIAQFAGGLLEVPFDFFKRGLESSLVAVGALDDRMTAFNNKLRSRKKDVTSLILDLQAEGLISEKMAREAFMSGNSRQDVESLDRLMDYLNKQADFKRAQQAAAEKTLEQIEAEKEAAAELAKMERALLLDLLQDEEKQLAMLGEEAAAREAQIDALVKQKLITEEAAKWAKELNGQVMEFHQGLIRQAQAEKEASQSAEAAAAAERKRQENLRQSIQLMEKRNRLLIQETQNQLEGLRANFRFTSFERRETELELLRRKVELYDQEIARLRELRDLQDSEEGRQMVGQRLDSLASARDGASGDLAGMEATPDPQSFRDQMEANFTALREQWGTFEQQVAQSFTGTIASAVDSISAGLANALVITGRWKEALASIPQMIGVQIVQSIIRMGLQWVATQVMMMLLGKSLMAAATAATLPIATATAAIWAGPATLAAIASGGSLPAAAPGMIATSMGMTKALSLTGFKTGGYTGDGGTDDVAGVVHGGEYVIHNQALRKFGLGFFESINRMQMPLATPRTGGGAAGGAAPVNVQAAQPQIIIVQSEAEALRALESRAGEARVMKMVDRRLMDLGVRG